MLSQIHRAEPLHQIFYHEKDQYGSPYNHISITVKPSHCCKETPIGSLYTEKIAEAVWPMY